MPVHNWHGKNLARPDGRISTCWKGMNGKNKEKRLLRDLEEAAGMWFLAGHCVATDDVANEPVWGTFFFSPKAFTWYERRRICPVLSPCFSSGAPFGLQKGCNATGCELRVSMQRRTPWSLISLSNKITGPAYLLNHSSPRSVLSGPPRLLPLCLAAALYRRLIQSM